MVLLLLLLIPVTTEATKKKNIVSSRKPLPNEGVFYFWCMKMPPPLKPGDRVAVVNPAKRLQSDMEAGLGLLKAWGLEPMLGKHVNKEHQLFAGEDAERLEDLQWALEDPEVKAIIIARGGYGTTRILDQLNLDNFLKEPKWVCGFSDITTLLCRLDNEGVAAIHGPMVASMGRNEDSDEYLRGLLFGQSLSYTVKGTKSNVLGQGQGELIGGNLTMICNSIGTSSEINTKNRILFLEEVGEYIYHLDRMMVHLLRAGKLGTLQGIVIGDFSSMKDHNDSFGMSTLDVLKSHFNHLGCPVAYGFPAGHEKKNYPMAFGVPAMLQVGAEKVRLDISQ